MKRRLPGLWVSIGLLIFFSFLPVTHNLQAKPFTHKETYGKWTKKVASDGSESPLYITFAKEYSTPDEQGVVYDRASITVMEPPSDHNSYEEFSKFMSPESIQQPENIRLTANPVESYTMYIGGIKAKVLSGTGSMVSLNGSTPNFHLLGKGYYLTLRDRVIEILAQVQAVKGDLKKIEAEIDELVTSFRFGEAEDLIIVRAIKGIPFQLTNSSSTMPIKPTKLQIPWDWMILVGVSIGLIILVWLIHKNQRRSSTGKLGKKKRTK
ncbi:MAG: hypothetical protein PHD83_01755 [Caldisericia bacterium]|nr:hypothetical protein [Caldisericia bacterium]